MRLCCVLLSRSLMARYVLDLPSWVFTHILVASTVNVLNDEQVRVSFSENPLCLFHRTSEREPIISHDRRGIVQNSVIISHSHPRVFLSLCDFL